MSYFNDDKNAAINEALAIVRLGLQSGAITTGNSSHYSDENTGKYAGAYLGEMIRELASQLQKL